MQDHNLGPVVQKNKMQCTKCQSVFGGQLDKKEGQLILAVSIAIILLASFPITLVVSTGD